MQIRKLVAGLFILLIVIGGCYVSMVFSEKAVYNWGGLLGTFSVGLILASNILGEQPMEFFENFSEWKRAKLSSLFMIGACISGVAFIVESIKMVIATMPH